MLRFVGECLPFLMIPVCSDHGWPTNYWSRYTRPGSTRVYANATDPGTNKYLAISAFKSNVKFADGGSLAIQIINNGPKGIAVPLTLQGVGAVKGIKTYLLNNDHNLEAVNRCTNQGDKIVATMPSLSMIVLSIDY